MSHSPMRHDATLAPFLIALSLSVASASRYKICMPGNQSTWCYMCEHYMAFRVSNLDSVAILVHREAMNRIRSLQTPSMSVSLPPTHT